MANREVPGERLRAELWPRMPQYDADVYGAILDSYGISTALERSARLEESVSEAILDIEAEIGEHIPAEEAQQLREDIRGVIENFKARVWEDMFVKGPRDAA